MNFAITKKHIKQLGKPVYVLPGYTTILDRFLPSLGYTLNPVREYYIAESYIFTTLGDDRLPPDWVIVPQAVSGALLAKLKEAVCNSLPTLLREGVYSAEALAISKLLCNAINQIGDVQ